MSKFQQLVESSLIQNSELNEGKIHDIGNAMKNGINKVKDVGNAIAYHSTRNIYLKGLNSKSPKEQLDAAHAHMNSNFADFHDRAKIGAVIAKHPEATSEHLQNAIRSGYYTTGENGNSVIRDAIKHPNVNENVLKTAISSLRYGGSINDHSTTLNKIINHPKASAEVLNHATYIAKNKGDDVALNNIAKHPNTSANSLEKIAHGANDEILASIANHKAVNKNVAATIAGNPNVSLKVLSKLSDHHLPIVADAIVSHKDASPKLIDKIVKGGHGIIQASVNPNTSAETLDHIAKLPPHANNYHNAFIKDSIIANPNTSANTLRHMYNENKHLHNDILKHPNAGGLRKFGLPK